MGIVVIIIVRRLPGVQLFGRPCSGWRIMDVMCQSAVTLQWCLLEAVLSRAGVPRTHGTIGLRIRIRKHCREVTPNIYCNTTNMKENQLKYSQIRSAILQDKNSNTKANKLFYFIFGRNT
jgi:hypothetical protein